TAREVNDGKPKWVIEKVKAAVGDYLLKHPKHTAKDISVALFGLAFKPDIDDLRESPSLAIAQQLHRELTGQLLVVEPNIHEVPESLLGCSLVDAEQGISEADVCVVLVGHKQFRELDFS